MDEVVKFVGFWIIAMIIIMTVCWEEVIELCIGFAIIGVVAWVMFHILRSFNQADINRRHRNGRRRW